MTRPDYIRFAAMLRAGRALAAKGYDPVALMDVVVEDIIEILSEQRSFNEKLFREALEKPL